MLDDEPLVRRAILRAFGGRDDVEAVDDARTALALLDRGEKFDAMLCDLMMPEMNGVEFDAALTARAPELAKRTGFMTGGPFTEVTREFAERMGGRVVRKPFQLAELVRLVEQLLAPSAQTPEPTSAEQRDRS